MSSNQDKGVPLAEAAKQLDVSQELLRKRIYRGLVTGHKVGGRWYVVLNGQASRPDSIQDSKQDHSGRNQDCQDKRDSLFEAIIDGQRSEIGFLRDEMAKQREQWAEEARRKDIIIADLARRVHALPETVGLSPAPQMAAQDALATSANGYQQDGSWWTRVHHLMQLGTA